MRNIRITPYGNIGNQMFQYMFALALQERVPSCTITGLRMAPWGLSDEGLEEPAENRFVVAFRRNRVPFDALTALVAAESRIDVRLDGVNLRLEYWAHLRDRLIDVFPEDPGARGGGPDELVVNVRAAEILEGVHRNYVPTPIGLHEALVERLGLRPVFVGQLESSAYADELRRRFPDARFVSHGTPLGDFEFVRASANVLVAVSTYSWLAAWLSRRARRIFLPALGLFDHRVRGDIDLVPEDDDRYVVLRADPYEWEATPAQLEAILHAPASAFGFDVAAALASRAPS